MPILVRLNDIIEALEMSSDSITFYLDKRTGKVEMIPEDITAGMEMEDDNTPEGQREGISMAREIETNAGEHFIELPSEFDINDYEIMEKFSREYPNDSVSATLQDAIRGKGAFRRFSELVDQLSIRHRWHEFQQQAYEEIAVDWLEANELPYTRGGEVEPAGEA